MLDGTRVITPTGTSTAAFIGEFTAGPQQPARVGSWKEFAQAYPDAVKDTTSFLPDAVQGFFTGGGTTCYVIGVSASGGRVEGYKSALSALEDVADVNIVAVPDLWRDEEDAPVIGRAVAQHCAQAVNRLAILHTKQGLTPSDAAKVPRLFDISADSDAAAFSTIYYPWASVESVAGTTRLAPACGHVAGVWARTDTERGVFKAPANQSLNGVDKLELDLSDHDNGQLNDVGVNCLRSFPGRGSLVWGARTLSSSRDWRYLNVRRLTSFLMDSIRTGTTWTVFEPNDEQLRAGLRSAVTSFLADQWRGGALQGRTPEEAFFVACDATNNTDGAAKVVIKIGIAPVRPAEFLSFSITQITSTDA
ncbi:hypothetical protein BFF78_00595 [Streptomyces fodineus]|uniref:Phage tail protein n=1 Tax=Streptomyces fodineus TaxID=1904616 RepID=A0A1D7Y324_9ACTN|nr:phage tail sheath subtilisin-like domain-containing protein [Streptomyces fodineus]AOR29789.1 hypothetical protein BFF78_00595 [Streptomyces fodineus]